MSFRRAIATTRQPTVVDLERRLTDEFRTPNLQQGVQPIIHAEPPEPDPIKRLFVIWDDWAELDLKNRSEIIMNAFQSVYGLPTAAKVTIAMGLTSAEAERMGIK